MILGVFARKHPLVLSNGNSVQTSQIERKEGRIIALMNPMIEAAGDDGFSDLQPVLRLESSLPSWMHTAPDNQTTMLSFEGPLPFQLGGGGGGYSPGGGGGASDPDGGGGGAPYDSGGGGGASPGGGGAWPYCCKKLLNPGGAGGAP